MPKKLNLDIKKHCLNCNKELNIIINRDIERKNFCSRSCCSKYYHKIGAFPKIRTKNINKIDGRSLRDIKGSKNPMFGKKRPEVSKRIKDKWAKGEFDFIKSNMKNNNPMKYLEIARKVSITKSNRIDNILKNQDLKDLYCNKKYSAYDIGKMFNISTNAVLKRLKILNISIREDIFHKKNRRFVCDDGHIVDSSFERNVDNWLFHNNVIHNVHYKVFQNRKFTADFKIGDVLIECDGLLDKRIGNSFKEKLELYRKNNIKFLVLKITEDIGIKLGFVLNRQKIIQENLDKFINRGAEYGQEV